MFFKEIDQCRDKQFCIVNGFIFIWRIRFLFNFNIRVCFKEIFVVKSSVANDAETVGNNAEFVGVYYGKNGSSAIIRFYLFILLEI